jgi:hypothetical protein
MTRVTCADGAVLSVEPVPVLGRDGVPYEVTLRLLRDGEPFGEVGERCGYFLAATRARLCQARLEHPERFPHSSVEAGVRAWARDRGYDGDSAWAAAERYLPRDRELFAHLSRDPDDLGSVGELRVSLRTERRWLPSGGWELRSLAVLEAWGSNGAGLRCALTAAQLQAFLDELVEECGRVGVVYDSSDDGTGLRRPVG